MNGRTVRAAAGAAAVVGLATACGPGYQDLPLPGRGVDGPTYTINAPFQDALNLTEGARVKIGGLPVGRVTELRAEGFHAVASMEIEDDVELRAGTTARLRYDTPLGEVFVELTPASAGKAIEDGGSLAATKTSTAPSVEDTLAQASLLVNGGGLTQVQTINEELNDVLGGREANVRSVMYRANAFLAQANAASGDLDGLLRDLNATSAMLMKRKEVFGEAIRALGPMAEVLRRETPTLTRLLARSNQVVARTNGVLDRTDAELVQILHQLGPILDEIVSVEPQFVDGLRSLAAARRILDQAVPGDVVPQDALLHLDLRGLLDANAPSSGGSSGTGDTQSGGLLGGLTGTVGGLLGPGSDSSGGGGLPLLNGLLGGSK
ncbi:MCE family protein [Nocardioides jiangxiensis]|uniref:MCE family protein n=1 Tax=Nocardioides jiangxiensis TaxID=3064524 RepID=A0ABT9AXQ8_9ACTN|nr:MCE family protein [Nocardioides sp. WY-20]MDO7867249.1 MCE family protein [Nocardioides sp. WY-20]